MSTSVKLKIWKYYIDNSFELVKNKKRDELTEHLNHMDAMGSIKFTDELEAKSSIPFLVTLISRKEDGSVQIQVYWKKIHSDQYIYFNSNHSLKHKQGVIWMVQEHCDRPSRHDEGDNTHGPDSVKVRVPWEAFKNVKQQIDQKVAEP